MPARRTAAEPGGQPQLHDPAEPRLGPLVGGEHQVRRVAVLADRRVLVNAPLAEVEKFDHPWIQEYFHGPRGRAAQSAQEKL